MNAQFFYHLTGLQLGELVEMRVDLRILGLDWAELPEDELAAHLMTVTSIAKQTGRDMNSVLACVVDVSRKGKHANN